jgi:hypothetical protein
MREPNRPVIRPKRLLYGAIAYWALNIALLFAEMQWHILSRLTVWDIEQIKSLVPMIQELVHRG